MLFCSPTLFQEAQSKLFDGFSSRGSAPRLASQGVVLIGRYSLPRIFCLPALHGSTALAYHRVSADGHAVTPERRGSHGDRALCRYWRTAIDWDSERIARDGICEPRPGETDAFCFARADDRSRLTLSLAPVLWSRESAETRRNRIAVPIVGGVMTSTIHVLVACRVPPTMKERSLLEKAGLVGTDLTPNPSPCLCAGHG